MEQSLHVERYNCLDSNEKSQGLNYHRQQVRVIVSSDYRSIQQNDNLFKYDLLVKI